MTASALLAILSALGWVLLFGLGVSVLRLQQAVIDLEGRMDSRDSGPEIGTVAPEIEGTTMHGDDRIQTSVSSHPRLVWFLSTTCKSCWESRSLVERIARDLGESVASIVSVEGTVEDVKAFAEPWKSDVPVVADPEGMTRRLWHVARVPSVVFVGQDGLVKWRGRQPPSRQIMERMDSA